MRGDSLMPDLHRTFASDNNAGVHPAALAAIAAANVGHVVGYGDDLFTRRMEEKFAEHFGREVQVFVVFNGTAANVLSLQATLRSYQAAICSSVAHLQQDECGAAEKIAGCKVLPVPAPDGKVTPAAIRSQLRGSGNVQRVQPKLVSVTQSTEVGTVYTIAELRAISELCREHALILHVDGARLANAAVTLGVPLKAITTDVGVDILSFGGTKNGLLGCEAIVVFRPELARDLKFIRKQSMQLASKMRFISAQFEALLSNDLWLRNASNANAMASLLAERLSSVEGVTLTCPVEANAVFAKLSAARVREVQQRYFFYVWATEEPEWPIVRWMTSFDTTAEDIEAFVRALESTAR